MIVKTLVRFDTFEPKCAKMAYIRQKYCNIIGCEFENGTPESNKNVIMFRYMKLSEIIVFDCVRNLTVIQCVIFMKSFSRFLRLFKRKIVQTFNLDVIGINYFRIPQDETTQRMWIESIRTHQPLTQNDHATSQFKVCSNHFKQDELVKSKGRIVTKGIPRLFPRNAVTPRIAIDSLDNESGIENILECRHMDAQPMQW